MAEHKGELKTSVFHFPFHGVLNPNKKERIMTPGKKRMEEIASRLLRIKLVSKCSLSQR